MHLQSICDVQTEAYRLLSDASEQLEQQGKNLASTKVVFPGLFQKKSQRDFHTTLLTCTARLTCACLAHSPALHESSTADLYAHAMMEFSTCCAAD